MYFHGDAALEACSEPLCLRGEFPKPSQIKVGCFLQLVSCWLLFSYLRVLSYLSWFFGVQIEVLLLMLYNNLSVPIKLPLEISS